MKIFDVECSTAIEAFAVSRKKASEIIEKHGVCSMEYLDYVFSDDAQAAEKWLLGDKYIPLERKSEKK